MNFVTNLEIFDENHKFVTISCFNNSHVNFWLDYKNKEVTITSLFVDIEKRNKGIGTLLLQKCFDYCKNFKKFLVDDMSDMYDKKSNIYLKNGFRYIDYENGHAQGPEMIKYI
jgi:GNAT superfamily N-acetyltransferase